MGNLGEMMLNQGISKSVVEIASNDPNHWKTSLETNIFSRIASVTTVPNPPSPPG